jgi:hypothetical protein
MLPHPDIPSRSRKRRKMGDQPLRNLSNSSSLSEINKPKLIRIIGGNENFSFFRFRVFMYLG